MSHSQTKHTILAIETSCDETAVAILTLQGKCLAHKVVTQQEHLAYGGIVPEIAARAHLQKLPLLAQRALEAAHITTDNIACVAASTGPGLIGGLIVGSNFGKAVAISLDIPFFAINHIEAHALSVRLPQTNQKQIPFPYLLLLISGGHCGCIAVNGVGDYKILGQTRDDAAGEAFDKTAKMLGLPWPGGPNVEKLAKDGVPTIPLPHPLCREPGCDFSFSGLKSAIARKISQLSINRTSPKIIHKTEEDGSVDVKNIKHQHQLKANLAASFQKITAEIIGNRMTNALEMMPFASSIVAAGGVAANRAIRIELEKIARKNTLSFHAPPPHLCTDNAVMVGWACIEILNSYKRRHLPLPDDITCRPRPRWNLEEMKHGL